ncbi:MAG: GFA family protein, partial [Aestuariivirga sp.]|nr:GFA family protein [Aestuariivirga sp.]
MKTGSCLCGAVSFEVHGTLRPVLACHCVQCRKQTGNYMSATACADKELVLTRDEGLTWFRSSAEAQRGFCRTCGSVLFWKADGSDTTSISAGAIDGPTGAPLE